MALIDFLIVALGLFLIIRQVNQMRAKEEEEAPPGPTTKECPFCRLDVAIEAFSIDEAWAFLIDTEGNF